jgi:hypothetical protein
MLVAAIAFALWTVADAPAGSPAGAPPATGPVTSSPARDPVDSDGLRILVVPRDDVEAARVDALYAGLRGVGLAPVGLEERAGVDRPVPPELPPATRDGVRIALQDARVHYRALDDLDVVRGDLTRAVDELVRLDRPEDALDVLDEILLLRADVALVSGNVESAQHDLLLLARLAPERTELHPGLYAPRLVEAYARARKRNSEAAEATLVVQPRVANRVRAEVDVDGVRTPATDVELHLGAGPHLVTVRAIGVASVSSMIDLRADDTTVIDPFVAPRGAPALRQALTHQVQHAPVEDERLGALDRLAPLSAAGAVLVVVGPRAQLYVPGRGLLLLPVTSKAEATAIGRATLALLQQPVVDDTTPPPPDLTHTDSVDFGAVALLTTVGVTALAGLGVAIWALAPPSPGKAPARPVVVSCCVN